MLRRPPRSTQSRSSAASDVYKRQALEASGTTNNALQTPQRTGASGETSSRDKRDWHRGHLSSIPVLSSIQHAVHPVYPVAVRFHGKECGPTARRPKHTVLTTHPYSRSAWPRSDSVYATHMIARLRAVPDTNAKQLLARTMIVVYHTPKKEPIR